MEFVVEKADNGFIVCCEVEMSNEERKSIAEKRKQRGCVSSWVPTRKQSKIVCKDEAELIKMLQLWSKLIPNIMRPSPRACSRLSPSMFASEE